MKSLNERHKAFCDEYLVNGQNGTKAYLTVYKSVKSQKTAEVNASKLLSNAKIKAYIATKLQKTSEKLDIKREDMMRSLLNRAKLVDEMQELASKEKLTSQEENKYHRLLMLLKASDGNKAWEAIAKLNGWNAPEKQEIEHKGLEGFQINIKKKDD